MYYHNILRSADICNTLDRKLRRKHWCLVHTGRSAKLLRDVDVVIGCCGGSSYRKRGCYDSRGCSFVHNRFMF
nr:MAG TPA: hypothetical protein [Caudoviricetes sp.]